LSACKGHVGGAAQGAEHMSACKGHVGGAAQGAKHAGSLWAGHVHKEPEHVNEEPGQVDVTAGANDIAALSVLYPFLTIKGPT